MIKKILVIMVLIISLTLSTDAFAKEQKIGIINFRKVGSECKKGKEYQKEMEAKDRAIGEELEKKLDEIRKLRDEIDLLSEKAKEKRRAELREKSLAFDKVKRDKTEELIRWRDTKMSEISNDIVDVTAEFAEENGYNLIIDRMASVYSLKKYDITDDIIKRLNK